MKTWREFFVSVISLLHERDGTILQELALSSENPPVAQTISTNEDIYSMSDSQRIAEEIYLRVHRGASSKISLIKKYLKLFDVEPGEITITVSNPVASTVKSVNSQKKEETYFKFWNQLLVEINTKTDIYQNRTPNISGLFTAKSILGGGMSYYMSINLKGCAVGFRCSNNDKMKNKKLYDYIYSHKNEIENKIGLPVYWDRGDTLQISFLSIRLDDIDFMDESTWPQINSFMVGNTVALSEVLTPILQKY